MRLFSFFKVSQQLRHNWFLKTAKVWWKKIVTDSPSPEYRQWRHQFILKRLYLMTWVSVIVYSLDTLVDWIIIVPSLNPSYPQYHFIQQNSKLLHGTLIVFFVELLFAFFLLKISFIRRYPLLIFLWLNWTLLLTAPVIFAIFRRQNIPDFGTWWITFPAEVIFLPVRWQWHLLSQGITLGHFAVNYLLFGSSHPLTNYQIDYFAYVYSTIVVCSIANLGAFLYERLLQQEFELRRQLRLFLHTVSHDLRSPVLGTMFLLKSLRHPTAKETTISNEIIDRTIESSDRQLQLIDSLLEAHTTETRGIAIRPRPVCINDLVQSVITDMQPFLHRDRAIVTKKIPAKFPLVNIDPLHVRRVYENLIANALEYNQPGLHLTLEVQKTHKLAGKQQKPTVSDRWIYCTVRDNGIGISPQQSSHVFDLYTRATSNKQSLNVGLGLYICRQIINAHGGEIGVHSSDRGVSFWFTLPAIVD